MGEVNNSVSWIAAGRRRLSMAPGVTRALSPSIVTRATSSVISAASSAHISEAIVNLPIPEAPMNARPWP